MKKYVFSSDLIIQKAISVSIGSLYVDFLNRTVTVTFNYLDQSGSFVTSQQRVLPLPEDPDWESFALSQLAANGVLPSGEIEAG